MHENQVYRKHSDEFRDVISRFPKKSNSLLLALILFIIVVGLILGWVIKSPDVILAEVKVTAQKPPVALVSKLSGNIVLKNAEIDTQIKKDEYIAVIENSANENHMQHLKSKLGDFKFDSIPSFEEYSFALNYNLGELQNTYFDFLKTIYELNQFFANNKYAMEINSIENQISYIHSSINKRKEILDIKNSNIRISKKNVKTDSVLSKKGALIPFEYEKSKKLLFRELEDKAFQENEVIKDKLNVVSLKDKITSLSIENNETLQGLKVKLLTNYQNLLNELNQWEQNFVFKAPFDGKLEYLKFVVNNQFINQGESVFSVLPLNNIIIGQAFLPSEGAGKVDSGQEVIIKLDTYPYQEFGSLVGKVKSISLTPLEKVYLVNIDLPSGLKSDNGIELNFSREMSGQAEIITVKRRLISRLFERIKYAFEKKRKKDILPEENDNTDNAK